MTGRGVTVVVVDDGVEHTIKDIEPNYVSASSVAGGCKGRLEVGQGESARLPADLCCQPGLGQGGKSWWQTSPWEILHLSCRLTGLCATCGRWLLRSESWPPSDPQQLLKLLLLVPFP